MEMIPFLMALYMLMPVILGVFARSYGRSFWRWFFIGTFVPAVSFVLLYWVTGKDEEKGVQE